MDLSSEQDRALYDAWLQWANRELKGSKARIEAAAAAAVDAALVTRDSDAAQQAARLAVIAPAAARSAAVAAQVAHADYVAAELSGFQATYPGRSLTVADAIAWYRRRRIALGGAPEVPAGSATSAAAADFPSTDATTSMPAAPATPTAAPAGPLFSGDQGVLILSYVGAFLLIVATLLFEVYGLGGINGPTQFVLVLLLNLFFGGVGWACLRQPRLRVVGTIYVGIFALTTPLVLVAAYEFLALKQYGISADSALFVGGVYCCGLYGLLATRLGSGGYAWLSLASLPFAAYGAVAAAGFRDWSGLAFAFTAIAYVYLGRARSEPAGVDKSVFRAPAEVLAHVVSALAAVTSLSFAGRELAGEATTGAQDLVAPFLPLTFAAISLLYSAYAAARGGRAALVVAAAGATFTVLSSVVTFRGDSTAAALALLALALGYAAAASQSPDRSLASFLRAGAATQAIACAVFPVHPDPLQAAVLLAASAVGVFLTLDSGEPLWLLVAGSLFAVAWFWVLRVAISLPENATPSTLAVGYSPLPPIFLAIALVGRRALPESRAWTWPGPMELMSAVIAGGVLAAGVTDGNLLLVGWLLVVYGAIAYASAMVERESLLAPFAIGAVAAGVFFLMAHVDTATWVYPLVFSFGGAVVWASHLAWAGGERGDGIDWRDAHRFTGIGLAVVTAVATAGVPDFLLYHVPLLEPAAVFVGSLGLDWLARFAGADNPQYYVLAPGLALLATGLIMKRRHPDQLILARGTMAAGAALLLGTTWLQALGDLGTDSLYTALLVAEGAVATGVGIGLRDRVIVVAGATAVALAALRAFFQVLQEVPLSLIFGAIALVILAVAAALALQPGGGCADVGHHRSPLPPDGGGDGRRSALHRDGQRRRAGAPGPADMRADPGLAGRAPDIGAADGPRARLDGGGGADGRRRGSGHRRRQHGLPRRQGCQEDLRRGRPGPRHSAGHRGRGGHGRSRRPRARHGQDASWLGRQHQELCRPGPIAGGCRRGRGRRPRAHPGPGIHRPGRLGGHRGGQGGGRDPRVRQRRHPQRRRRPPADG